MSVGGSNLEQSTPRRLPLIEPGLLKDVAIQIVKAAFAALPECLAAGKMSGDYRSALQIAERLASA